MIPMMRWGRGYLVSRLIYETSLKKNPPGDQQREKEGIYLLVYFNKVYLLVSW